MSLKQSMDAVLRSATSAGDVPGVVATVNVAGKHSLRILVPRRSLEPRMAGDYILVSVKMPFAISIRSDQGIAHQDNITWISYKPDMTVMGFLRSREIMKCLIDSTQP